MLRTKLRKIWQIIKTGRTEEEQMYQRKAKHLFDWVIEQEHRDAPMPRLLELVMFHKLMNDADDRWFFVDPEHRQRAVEKVEGEYIL